MKINVEFESFDEMKKFAAELAGGSAAAPAEAPRKTTRRKTKAEREAAAKAAEAEQNAAGEPAAPAEPEKSDPSSAPLGSPALTDVDAARQRFKEFVGENYEAALKMVEELECETFDEVAEAGKLPDLLAAMDAAAA